MGPMALALVAAVFGLLAVQMQSAQGQRTPLLALPDANCVNADCGAVSWTEPPVDPNGNSLPGETCSIPSLLVDMCVVATGNTCQPTGTSSTICTGVYRQANVLKPCAQRINNCNAGGGGGN